MKKAPVEFYFLLAALLVVYIAARGKLTPLVAIIRGQGIQGPAPTKETPKTSPSYFVGERTGKEQTLSGGFLPIG